jgi:SAM-dependent methyltransferase
VKKNLISKDVEISFAGERVSHLYQNDCYFAHLSIYHFAARDCQGKIVLDAGCGGGYGSAYLAEHNAARVEAVDISSEAIGFCSKSFSRPNLHYQVMDLANLRGFAPGRFDLIFSSNALEHVWRVERFFHAAHKLLKPDGSIIIAVPPAVDKISWQNNLENPFHLNIWTPNQWLHMLSYFFEEVHCHLHTPLRAEPALDFNNRPDQTRVTEIDFGFEEITVDDFYRRHSLTIIFRAVRPRSGVRESAWRYNEPLLEGSLTRRPTFKRPNLLHKFYAQLRRTFKT